jgi:flagellar biosynthesis chaperone FliJ
MALKFSLQNVLDIRHGKVELLEIELSKLLIAQQQTEVLLMSLQEFQVNLLDQLTSAQSGEIDLFKIGSLRLNILDVTKRFEIVAAELEKQNLAIKNKRAELVTAKQAEETLEILKRNRHEVYLAEQIQVEAREQDDIYIAQAFRNTQHRKEA